MKKKLSPRDLRLKEALEATLASPDMTWVGRGRRFFGLLPSDPRCTGCHAPFAGPGSVLVRIVFNKRRSQTNPLLCSTCEDSARRTHAGIDVQMSILFVDIRGSTRLAEEMSASSFKQLIDRFYSEITRVLSHSLAFIDKLAGDEVSGFYLPAVVGRSYARQSVKAAMEILHVTGHDGDSPWAPVGIGINTGVAYFGSVGEDDNLVELTALGDPVNVAARLASEAATGEILLSESTVRTAGIETNRLDHRKLDLKGKSEPVDVWVMTLEHEITGER